jgi:uncharacterized protein YgbK (DUF1537 family)
VTRFRLLADDLTGALDSAAQFCRALGPVPVAWANDETAPALAIDCASRDLDAGAARARVAALAGSFDGADLAFKKLDSLLRGHAAAEIAACMVPGKWDAVVIATAFPAQGRIMRHGRQLAHGSDVGVDLAGALADLGIPVAHRKPGDALPPGVSLWDAETDADLDAIAVLERRRVLWCGTAGLAGALARQLAPGAATAARDALAQPVVALVGSDHAVARAQVAACGIRVTLAGDAPDVGHGAVVTVAIPDGMARAEAAARIAAEMSALLARLDRPGTLIASGGETLRAVCIALGATGLIVDGEAAPGVAASRLRDGRWQGLRIVSKSGAFGDARLLARLLEGGLP